MTRLESILTESYHSAMITVNAAIDRLRVDIEEAVKEHTQIVLKKEREGMKLLRRQLSDLLHSMPLTEESNQMSQILNSTTSHEEEEEEVELILPMNSLNTKNLLYRRKNWDSSFKSMNSKENQNEQQIDETTSSKDSSTNSSYDNNNNNNEVSSRFSIIENSKIQPRARQTKISSFNNVVQPQALKAVESESKETFRARVKRAGWLMKRDAKAKRLAVGLSPLGESNRKNSTTPLREKISPPSHQSKLITRKTPKLNVKNSPVSSKVLRASPTNHIRARGVDAQMKLRLETAELAHLNVRVPVTLKQKEKSIGTDCSQCEDFLGIVCKDANGEETKAAMNAKLSKHRYYRLPQATPVGYWDVEFPSSPDQKIKQ